ncbi:hypothetical protein Acr_11g0000600 [Actinidia rufa]|uniref:Pentatricopeptide repeat (PPR) superfamily protein n=1 Tax=Actinidia rufa TaxID=165716 RepID=A0A7J0FAM0_9ERIC|nr:hypothetical protein Acr_11g0000600 [Actinidia rufa]
MIFSHDSLFFIYKRSLTLHYKGVERVYSGLIPADNACFLAQITEVLGEEWERHGCLDALEQMKIDGIKPNVVCYTLVSDGVVEEGKFEIVDKLFDKMLVLGLVPNIHTCNVYINGLCKQNKLEEGVKMLASMGELGLSHPQRLDPSVRVAEETRCVCYPLILTYFWESPFGLVHRPSSCMKMSTKLAMKRQSGGGAHPSRGFCEVGKLSRAMEIVKEMGSKGVKLDLRSYGIIIDGLVKKVEIDEACGMLKEVLYKGFIPPSPSSTFDGLICGLCKIGLVGKAMEPLKETVGKNIALAIRAWETLLIGSEFKSSFDEITSTDDKNLIHTGLLAITLTLRVNFLCSDINLGK